MLVRQTLRCTARADSTGGSIQMLQFAIALREYQLPLHALHWRVEPDNRVLVEITCVGPPVLIERFAERIVTMAGFSTWPSPEMPMHVFARFSESPASLSKPGKA